MVAIDKMNEFYTCAKRFAFLATKGAYRPEEGDDEEEDQVLIPRNVHDALDTICLFFSNDPQFLKRAEEAQEYFDTLKDSTQVYRRKDMLSQIVKDCCR
jgi:hypothetical protein